MRLLRLACIALFLPGFAGASERETSAAAPVAAPAPSERVSVRLLDLASIRRSFGALVRQRPAMSEGERVGAWSDFTTMAIAVVGDTKMTPFTFDELMNRSSTPEGIRVVASAGFGMRDDAAYQLLALGYSGRETADIVSGKISVQALDNARRMIAVGLSREEAGNYLDAQYKLVASWQQPQRPATSGRYTSTRSRAYDTLIERYAALHNVEASVVRAIMATESAFNPSARSPVGAIGLMQLMPMTARELGVNPFVIEENIEGGVRYFSQLLRMFGGLELALVAYNAGPGFAQRYAGGQAVLYGETRDYVKRVLSLLNSQ